MTAISATNLSKSYNGLYAVNDATFEVKAGEICGLIGRNGAGKTTLIRILTKLVKPSGGSYSLLDGQQQTSSSVAAIVEKPSLYGDLSGFDNLVCQCRLLGIEANSEYLQQTLTLVGLNPSLKIKAKNYSFGMKQRLSIAMTLLGKPKLLMLDEPTNGLDPQGIFEIRELLLKLNREMGITLLISSHILSELSKFATSYIFMEKGKIIKQTTSEELKSEFKKTINLTVDSPTLAATVLAQNNIAFSVGKTVNTLVVTSDIQPTALMLMLADKGVEVVSINTAVDELESFFINLVGERK